uniref:Multiple inositol polyphosphate phosphatase 1 n=1 Tax=Glossina brevipalpis TaxID=37001 RepID=A0A1A9WAX3_9MUSC
MLIIPFHIWFLCTIVCAEICTDNDRLNLKAISSPSSPPYCKEMKRSDIEKHFATKTPYRAIANFDDEPREYKGCQPTRIWCIIRHGTRYPSKGVIERAKNTLRSLKKHILSNSKVNLCSKHIEILKDWHFNVGTEEEKFLVAEGEDELIELAERLQNRFPRLLPINYDPSIYYFKYTATQRTFESAKSFATGLFGRHQIGQIIYPKALHKDPVLRD